MKRYVLQQAFCFSIILLIAGAASAQPGSHYERMQPRRPAGINMKRPPTPGGNAVWIEEDWKWNKGRYAWGGGYWSRPPYPGAVWMPGRWVQSRYGWQWMAGRWARRPVNRPPIRPHH